MSSDSVTEVPPPVSEMSADAERSAADAPRARRLPRLGERVRTVLAVVVVVAVFAAAVWFGVGWVRAAFFTDGPRAAARDAALDGARQAALNITSMKMSDVDGSLALARSSMTGTLLDTADKNKDQMKQRAVAAGVDVTSKVIGASVTELNSERDHASTLIVLEVDSAGPGKPADKLRFTWSIDMAEAGGVWKAEQVQSVGDPVPLDGQGQLAPPPPAPAPPAPAPQPGS
ncbi:hypothetical protein [Nocardia terpenica]|nr:hypothetical protein [Nocardia terpenica]